MTPMYHAYDGKPFPTVDECLAYEKTIPEWALVGLTIERVREAMARRDAALADAIEVIGGAIGRDRRADGDLKRERKPSAAPAPLAITGPDKQREMEIQGVEIDRSGGSASFTESAISTGEPRIDPEEDPF